MLTIKGAIGLEKCAFHFLLVGLLTLVLLPSFTAPPAFTTLALVFTFLGFVCDCLFGFKSKRRTSAPGLLFWGPLAILTYSLVANPATWAGVERSVVWMACFCGAASLANQIDKRGKTEVTAVLRCLGGALVVLTVRGMAEHLYLFDDLRREALAYGFTPPTGELGGFFTSNRARATFGQANGFAGFLLLLLPFCLSLAKHRTERAKKWLPLILLIGGFWACGSKGGGLVALVVTGLFLVRRNSHPRSRLLGSIILAAALVGVILCVSALMDANHFLPASLNQKFATLKLRQTYWSMAMPLIKAGGWDGIGVGLWGEYVSPTSLENYARFAHNGYIDLVVELGLGAILFGIMVAMVWFRPKPPALAIEPSEQGQWTAALPGLLALAIACSGSSLGLSTTSTWVTSFLTMGSLLLLADFFLMRPLIDRATKEVGFIEEITTYGVLGVLLHILVDFDLHITGVTATLAILLALRGSYIPKVSPRPWRFLLPAILVLGFLFSWVTGPAEVQAQRAGPRKWDLLSAWPPDLRQLYTLSRSAPDNAKKLRVLKAFDDLEDQFSQVPTFARRHQQLENH